MRRKYHIVGNWKMNQSLEDIKSFFHEVSEKHDDFKCEAWVAPQFVHIPIVRELTISLGNVQVGAQNCSHELSGAYTGDISPQALTEVGCEFTLIGHSERRAIFNEGNELLNKKLHLALEQKLTVIFCVGETLEEREAGNTNKVIETQIIEGLKGLTAEQAANVIIAYEPVWAIGTGKVATPEQAQEVHAFTRSLCVEKLPFDGDQLVILYDHKSGAGLFDEGGFDSWGLAYRYVFR